jgi:hypothetical protein
VNQFRMEEGVDISYTKFHAQIDSSPYNVVQPPENQLYVGWTEPGEWFTPECTTRLCCTPQIAVEQFRSI